MSAPPDEVLAAMAHAARGFSSDTFGIGRIKAALAAADALGWVLVPVEPTEEMIEDGCAIDCTRTACRARLECRDESGRATMREKWDAMLAAAPKVGE